MGSCGGGVQDMLDGLKEEGLVMAVVVEKHDELVIEGDIVSVISAGVGRDKVEDLQKLQE